MFPIKATATRLLLLILLCGFVGCSSQNVVEGISQSQATKIVAFLSKQGIVAHATKQAQNINGSDTQGDYTVYVHQDQYAQAVILLSENDLPKKEDPSFAETVSQKGFLPNGSEIEKLRVDRAKAAEIEEALRVNSEIKDIKVILKSSPNPTVSLVVKANSLNPNLVSQITSMVSRAVPGIQPEAIQVMFVEDSGEIRIGELKGAIRFKDKVITVPLVSFMGYFTIPEGSASSLSICVFSLLIIFGGLCAFVGYWYGFIQKTRVDLDEEKFDIPRLSKDRDNSLKLPKD